jgi:HEXXH motif-containing protein
LFGATLGEKLVENPDEERYPSPLRAEPRPMDGNVHAMYVLARVTYCLRRLLESGQLDRDEKARAEITLRNGIVSYENALPGILQNARFTPHGAEVFNGARSYMEAPV